MEKSLLSSHGNNTFPAPCFFLEVPCAARSGSQVAHDAVTQFPLWNLKICLFPYTSPTSPMEMGGILQDHPEG